MQRRADRKQKRKKDEMEESVGQEKEIKNKRVKDNNHTIEKKVSSKKDVNKKKRGRKTDGNKNKRVHMIIRLNNRVCVLSDVRRSDALYAQIIIKESVYKY
jgi:hypothetical protein